MISTERQQQHSQNMAQIDQNISDLQKLDKLFDVIVEEKNTAKAQNNLLRIHLVNFLNTWECRWDRKDFDKSEFSYEEIEEYREAAAFMAKFGRSNNRIDEVTEHLNSLTI